MRFINYAHRGASEYAPENTMAAFYLGLEMGADGIETDIQRTKDGVLVLFHDDDMRRIVGCDGAIRAYTYAELMALDFGKHKGKPQYAQEKIVRLEDFLRYFGGKDLALALEIKQAGVEADTVEMVRRFDLMDKVTFTSFQWESIARVRAIDTDAVIGYLVEGITPDTLDRLSAYRMQQICPRVGCFDDDALRLARDRGFSVRGWGVQNTALMREALRQKLDGITVNFPDLLAQALNEQR